MREPANVLLSFFSRDRPLKLSKANFPGPQGHFFDFCSSESQNAHQDQMTSQASSLVAPNELNTTEIGCSADAKLHHSCPLTLARIMGIPEEPHGSNEYLVRRTSEASKKCDTSPKTHVELSNKVPASTLKEARMSTSHMLDKTVLFAQLFSESSFHKKRHLDQADSARPVSKRARSTGYQENGDPCLPPRGVRYQRRNSFVIPNSKSMAFHRFNGFQGSIESLTNKLSLQENCNLTFYSAN